MSRRARFEFCSTSILHVACKHPGEIKSRKDGVSVSNERFKKEALPGAFSVTHLKKKFSDTWELGILHWLSPRVSSLYNSGYRQIRQRQKNLGKIFPNSIDPQNILRRMCSTISLLQYNLLQRSCLIFLLGKSLDPSQLAYFCLVQIHFGAH